MNPLHQLHCALPASHVQYVWCFSNHSLLNLAILAPGYSTCVISIIKLFYFTSGSPSILETYSCSCSLPVFLAQIVTCLMISAFVHNQCEHVVCSLMQLLFADCFLSCERACCCLIGGFGE